MAIEYDKLTFGLGLGMDYGGLGANVLYYPIDNLGVFGGFGYALAGAGYNAGLKLRILTDSSSWVNITVLGMYGYNAAVYVRAGNGYNKLFYGATFGFGLDVHP